MAKSSYANSIQANSVSGESAASTAFINFHDLDLSYFEQEYRSRFRIRLYRYLFFLSLFWSALVFASDIATAVLYFVGTNAVLGPGGSSSIVNAPWVRWVFVASLGIDMVLDAWEIFKARGTLRTGDISFIFSQRLAMQYTLLTSRAKFALYYHVLSKRAAFDRFALFTYLTLRTFKRLFLVLTPRRIVTVIYLTRYATRILPELFSRPSVDRFMANAAFAASLFQVCAYAISVLLFVIAFIGFLAIVWGGMLRRRSQALQAATGGAGAGKSKQQDESGWRLKVYVIRMLDRCLMSILEEHGFHQLGVSGAKFTVAKAGAPSKPEDVYYSDRYGGDRYGGDRYGDRASVAGSSASRHGSYASGAGWHNSNYTRNPRIRY